MGTFTSFGLCSFFLILGHVSCTFIALAPKEFHPGWQYTAQVMVMDVPNLGHRTTIFGTIFNGVRKTQGAGSVSLDNGVPGILRIEVAPNITPDPNNVYTLQLDATGGLSFSNSTPIQFAPLSHLTFVQTDRSVYNPGHTVRFRVVSVNKDLFPQKVAKNITFQNPSGITVARFYDNGTKSVYENTYPLSAFPGTGVWKIIVNSTQANVMDQYMFTVDEFENPKFTVDASVTPQVLVKESGQKKVTVSVTAKCTCGKGVTGTLRMTILASNHVFHQVISSSITDSSGNKQVELDLTEALAVSSDSGDNILISAEVTDDAGGTGSYHSNVTVKVVKQPVRMWFDKTRTDFVYRTGYPYQAVVMVTDPLGQALDHTQLVNPVILTLADSPVSTTPIEQYQVRFTPEQKVVVWNLPYLNSTGSLTLKAMLVLHGKKYEIMATVNRYQTLNESVTLNARWTSYFPPLNMGNIASFIVDVPKNVNFSSITYMIVSRGNIQVSGPVTAGQRVDVNVTTAMCPKGRVVVYGVTSVLAGSEVKPEVIADSLGLKLEHCRGKKVTPSIQQTSGGELTTPGSYVTLNVDVVWTDPSMQHTMAVGQHDVFLLAVDKELLRFQGVQQDITADRVENGLNRFNISSSAAGTGSDTDQVLEASRRRRKREVAWKDSYTDVATAISTGELLKGLGIVMLTDMNSVQPLATGIPVSPDSSTGMQTVNTTTVTHIHRKFADTWIWKSGKTNDMGRLSLVERLPDTVTSWMVSAFAVKDGSEFGITSDLLELQATKPLMIDLKVPYSIRRNEKVELKAIIYNHDSVNMDTSVSLAPSEDFVVTGDSKKTALVMTNDVSTMTFLITGNKVGTFTVRVTATAQRSSGFTITETASQMLVVKPEGVERNRSVTIPVMLTADQPTFDKNVTITYANWTLSDVIPASRKAVVKVTGDLMGHTVKGIQQLVQLPRGCGEQNMITTVPNICALAYLSAVGDLNADFEAQAKNNTMMGYSRQMQQYRWPSGGFSAFGTKDTAPSTWLTAFMLRSFARARRYIPQTVDLVALNEAVSFLFSRQTTGTGNFYELGKVIHSEMQSDTGSTEALSVYVAISLLEAKKHGVEINESLLTSAINYVTSVAGGEKVKQRRFLAAITAYALALNFQGASNNIAQANVERLIGNVVAMGAPWRDKDESATSSTAPQWYSSGQQYVTPDDVEVTAYCLLAYIAIGKGLDARQLATWLVKQQNSEGGLRSTQDTVVAIQALANYTELWRKSQMDTTQSVVVTGLQPSLTPRSVNIDSTNSALTQIIDLPEDTNKINIRVTGQAGSVAVVKVIWTFNTWPETDQRPPSLTHAVTSSNKKIAVTTRTTTRKQGLHNLEACVRPEQNLNYHGMVVTTLSLPSGLIPANLLLARNQSQYLARLEKERDQVHFYLDQPRDICINFDIEETMPVENVQPGYALLYAYYDPDIKSEAEIRLMCTGSNCQCTGGTCTAAAPSVYQFSPLLLLASVVLSLGSKLILRLVELNQLY